MKIAPRQPLTQAQFDLTTACVCAAVLPHLWRLPWLFCVPIAVLLLGRWLQRRRHGAPLATWLKLPLILIFPLLIIFHYGNIFGREPGAALACAMLVLKLVETETRRDARAAICFASFVLMSALLFAHSLSFTLILCAALILLLAAMRELEPQPTGAPTHDTRGSIVANLRGGAVTLAAAVPLALCVFVFFPRLGSPLWGAPTDTDARTGLSDRMAPGSVQQLLIDDSPAFRVSFDGPVPPRAQLYWRGPVLWYFDGTTWKRPGYFASRRASAELQIGADTIAYDISLEPTERRWLLALDIPIAAPKGAVRGADMSLVKRKPVTRLLRYHAVSALRYRLDATLDPAQRALALELPPGFDPRARALAQHWRGEFGNDDAIIHAALELFHNDFFYTLNAPLLGRNSVDDFLFDSKRGFCEHFSSAFTFLMRAAGIPARVVTGYQGGYFNATGNYLLVRQSDAHAWSEVWLAGRGWLRVDPTAAVSPQRVELGARAAAGASAPWYQANWLQALRNRLDLVNRFWNDAVVGFNALRQQRLLTPFGIDQVDYVGLMWVLIATSSLLLGLFAWWVLRTPRATTDLLDAAYTRLRRKLARAGAASLKSEGPLTLAARAEAMWPGNRDLQRLFAGYVNLRYASALATVASVRGFARAVAALRLRMSKP